jgi:hypothetical protein
MFFEVRKRRDLFLWLARTPHGPSVKFHVVNVHTRDELRLTGNCLRGSRPILSFDAAFDDEAAAPHLRLVRELLSQAFATPLGHPKSQPFHDHVMAFGWADNRVWFRHYAVVDRAADVKAAAKLLAAGEQPVTLVEIGPRFVLDIVRIFAGSLGGPTLYSNPRYMSPNRLRYELNAQKASRYVARKGAEEGRERRGLASVGVDERCGGVTSRFERVETLGRSGRPRGRAGAGGGRAPGRGRTVCVAQRGATLRRSGHGALEERGSGGTCGEMFCRPPQGWREGREGQCVEGDAAREGDALPDVAAQGGPRETALDQARGGAASEGLGRYGVVLEAEIFE